MPFKMAANSRQVENTDGTATATSHPTGVAVAAYEVTCMLEMARMRVFPVVHMRQAIN